VSAAKTWLETCSPFAKASLFGNGRAHLVCWWPVVQNGGERDGGARWHLDEHRQEGFIPAIRGTAPRHEAESGWRNRGSHLRGRRVWGRESRTVDGASRTGWSHRARSFVEGQGRGLLLCCRSGVCGLISNGHTWERASLQHPGRCRELARDQLGI